MQQLGRDITRPRDVAIHLSGALWVPEAVALRHNATTTVEFDV